LAFEIQLIGVRDGFPGGLHCFDRWRNRYCEQDTEKKQMEMDIKKTNGMKG
jgi:hypothetical protein